MSSEETPKTTTQEKKLEEVTTTNGTSQQISEKEQLPSTHSPVNTLQQNHSNHPNKNSVTLPNQTEGEIKDIPSYISSLLAGREGADGLIALTDQLNKEAKLRKEESVAHILKSTQDSPLKSLDSSNNTSEPNTNGNSRVIVPPETRPNYIDITDYLNMPQNEAAKKLNLPTSTLSKRWKEAAVNRKWPYRVVSKIEKEIMTLLHNIPQGPDSPPLPPEIQLSLAKLLRRRQEELRSVTIRL